MTSTRPLAQVHPTFSNNVRIEGLTIETAGVNTDGIDPDSCWNARRPRIEHETPQLPHLATRAVPAPLN